MPKARNVKLFCYRKHDVEFLEKKNKTKQKTKKNYWHSKTRKHFSVRTPKSCKPDNVLILTFQQQLRRHLYMLSLRQGWYTRFLALVAVENSENVSSAIRILILSTVTTAFNGPDVVHTLTTAQTLQKHLWILWKLGETPGQKSIFITTEWEDAWVEQLLFMLKRAWFSNYITSIWLSSGKEYRLLDS